MRAGRIKKGLAGLAFVAIVGTPAAVVTSLPAHGLMRETAGADTTKEGLEKDGYKCELVSTGFWECTKNGQTTYWCDASSCQPKPRTVRNPKLRHRAADYAVATIQ